MIPSLVVLALANFAPVLHAAEAKAELQSLVEKIKVKLNAGSRTEEALAEELKGFDTLLAAHQGEKTDDVAQIVIMKAMLYAQVLDNDDKAKELLKKLQTEYPATHAGQQAPELIASIDAQSESKKLQRSLKPGNVFPDFAEKDVTGKPLSLAGYKGKVVLVDFWATWCGPCVAELPNVLKAYEKYHSKGFEVVGISLDKDKEKLTAFTKEKNMPWAQYFDGLGWQSKLAGKYGVTSIPATYLLDKEGKVIGADLRGEALEEALAKALP